jgi:hypothetical protein
MGNSNEYMRNYMIERYHRRMSWARTILGGKCCKCGSVDNLQLDHCNPKQKTFTVGGSGWNCADQVFQAEVAKCQLLCALCHNLKTLSDTGKNNAKETHGTLSSYRYCKCNLCRTANNKYSREWKRKKRKQS